MNINVGDRVTEKYSNEKGVVELVQKGHLLIKWDNGFRDIVHINYLKHILFEKEIVKL